MFGVKQATEKGYIECINNGVVDLSYPTSKFRRGRVQGGVQYPLLLQQQRECVRSC